MYMLQVNPATTYLQSLRRGKNWLTVVNIKQIQSCAATFAHRAIINYFDFSSSLLLDEDASLAFEASAVAGCESH